MPEGSAPPGRGDTAAGCLLPPRGESPCRARRRGAGQDAGMELIKHGHACVVLNEDGRRLVIDPGAFTDPSVLQGANAVLVTHEHFDHVVPEKLRAAMEADPQLEVWTNGSVADSLEGLGSRVHVVGNGDAVTAACFARPVHGGVHA